LAAGEAYYAGMLALQAGHTAVIKEDEAARLAYLLQQYTLYAKTRSESDALTLTHADRLAKLQQELALQLAINQYGADSVEVAAMQRAAHEATLRAQENVTEEIIRAEMALYDAKVAADALAGGMDTVAARASAAAQATMGILSALRASMAEIRALEAGVTAAERTAARGGSETDTRVARAQAEAAEKLRAAGANPRAIGIGARQAGQEARLRAEIDARNKAVAESFVVDTGAAGAGASDGGSAQELATLTSITDAMLLRIERERELMGLQGIARRERELTLEIEEQLRQSGQMATEEAIQNAAREIAAREAVNETIRQQQSEMERIGKLLESSMTDAFMSIVDGTKSAEDAFKDMARLIIAELYKVLVVQQLVGQFKSGGGGILGALAGGLGGGGGGGTGALGLPMPFANGGAFMGGNVVPFARGGVVGSPTMFPMAGGRTGLMGEAGPEAIMPLKRGKDGKLGVASEGNGTTTVNNYFSVSANGDESVKRIVAQQVPAIAEATKAAVMDARQRGGKMRATFR
jgi:lambda family phage tail tape measure protein